MAIGVGLELVVVRHGVTQWNLEKRYQGQRDIELLMPDALEGMDRLRDYLEGERFDAVVTSDLVRCRQTLAHISEGRDWPSPRLDKRLRENDFGAFEGCTWEELKDDPAYRAWIDSAGELAPTGGESAQQLRERLEAALNDIFADAAGTVAERVVGKVVEERAVGDVAEKAAGEQRYKVLVVTHGGVIREWRRGFEQVSFWDGVVEQASGRRWYLTTTTEGVTCNSSSAVPVLASANV